MTVTGALSSAHDHFGQGIRLHQFGDRDRVSSQASAGNGGNEETPSTAVTSANGGRALAKFAAGDLQLRLLGWKCRSGRALASWIA